MITCQLQATPKGLGRLIEVIFKFLYYAQADCSYYSETDIPGRLADSYSLSGNS
jgi:hypothetical protein